jgi:type IV secretory pathway VirB2 component (pilin)
MNPPTNKPSEHPDALLLPYVEDMLDPEEVTPLETHLAACERCSAEVEALRLITRTLRESKEALCPETWEIYEVARRGDKVEHSLSRHLERCPRCREEMATLSSAGGPEIMPPELWLKVRGSLSGPTAGTRAVAEDIPPLSLWERFNRLFRLPALGVAVAAILLVLVMYPWEGTRLPTWDHAPRPKAGSEIHRPRAAVVILFKDFKKPFSDKGIYDLYQGVEPTIDVMEKFDMVAPATMSQFIGQGRASAHDRQEVLESLHGNLNVSLVVLVTVAPAAEGFQVQSELVNAATGAVSAEKTVRASGDKDLAPVMRDSVWALLLKDGPGSR